MRVGVCIHISAISQVNIQITQLLLKKILHTKKIWLATIERAATYKQISDNQ